MNRCFVVVEGPSDVILLRHLLQIPEEETQVEFKVAGGWSSADSLARSILASGEGDVVVIVDADSTDPNAVEERKRFMRRSLNITPSPPRRLAIVIAPELEVLFFRDKALLEELVGTKVQATDFIRGQYEPRRVLAELLGPRWREEVYARRLPLLNLDPIRQLPEIRELHEFIQETAVSLRAA